MTQFEKITQNPETLAAFLSSLPVIDGPWDKEFQARFCAGCAAENCDDCPNQRFRNNPGWWLTLTGPAETKKMGELHRIFADGTLGPEKRMEAFNAETEREAELAKRIWGLIMAEDPEPEQIETVLDTANTLAYWQTIAAEYQIPMTAY